MSTVFYERRSKRLNIVLQLKLGTSGLEIGQLFVKAVQLTFEAFKSPALVGNRSKLLPNSGD